MAFEGSPAETHVQFGLLCSALSVRQTPPPAAASQSRQCPWLQFGSMASAVTRPEVTYDLPEKLRMLGCVAKLGPASVQVPTLFLFFPWPRPLALLHETCAWSVSSAATESAGKARA